MKDKVEVFVCKECGYEDSSIIPMINKTKVECPNCKKNVDRHIELMEFGNYMTLKEYVELLAYIDEHHSFRNLEGKMIKYVRNSFDMRTNTIYQISIDDKEFTKVNENRHRDLKNWIYDYLNS